jgi:hypothetical protein
MIALYVLSGVAVALLSLAAFAAGLGYLIRSAGHLLQALGAFLPSGANFVTQMQDLRQQEALVNAPPTPAVTAGASPWPYRRPDRGVPPPPVDMTSPTDASMPPREPGDLDRFSDDEVIGMRDRPVVSDRAIGDARG